MQSVREHLHAHPEPSGEEWETTTLLQAQLDATRLAVTEGPGKRGLIVEPRQEVPGAKIALRADIDALRIQDAKDVPYRSQRDGVMHACGHDGHAAILLGAIWALDEAERSGTLPCAVPWRAIFQPAEETALGAIDMVNAGALRDVAAILATHLDPNRPTGAVGIRAGAFTADCVELAFHILGKGGHAARPHESQDPIATAAHLISSIYLFVPRATDTHDPVVVTIGSIRGGDTPNSIPEEVHLRGTLRTFSELSRRRTLDHLQKLCRGLAETSDTRIELTCLEGPPAVTNDPDLTSLIRREATALLGADSVIELAKPSMGGEDFANYLPHVPGAMFRLGCGPKGGPGAPLHSAHFDFQPEALAVGAKTLACAAVAWALEQSENETPDPCA